MKYAPEIQTDLMQWQPMAQARWIIEQRPMIPLVEDFSSRYGVLWKAPPPELRVEM